MEHRPAAGPSQLIRQASRQMQASPPEPVREAALQAIDYLAGDSITEVVGKLALFDAQGCSDEQTQTLVNALLLLCNQLVDNLADLQGIDQVRVLRKLAAEIIFQHFCALRRQARREAAQEFPFPSSAEMPSLVLHL